jgi:phage tail protein X
LRKRITENVGRNRERQEKEIFLMSYITSQGDTWDIISLKNYDDEAFVGELIEANPKYAEIVIFSAGTYINIPPKPETPHINTLPPWRRI